MPYTINGSAASFAPYSQEIEDLVVGHDGNGAPILSAYKNVVLTFDSANSSATYNQWSQFISTGTSVVSIGVLNADQNGFVYPSGVFLEWDRRPRLEAGAIIGPWSIRVTGVLGI